MFFAEQSKKMDFAGEISTFSLNSFLTQFLPLSIVCKKFEFQFFLEIKVIHSKLG